MKALALDIGGANIKAAHSDGGAWSVPFALWKEPAKLAEKLREVAVLAPPFDELRITMTGELCDCFATKREGVNHILEAVEEIAEGRHIRVWSVAGRFLDVLPARAEPIRVAASNWHALATYVAHLYPEGGSLLVDIGSTTTDIIRLSQGQVLAKGVNDMERLANLELVYCGAMRTPLMTIGPFIWWKGHNTGLMAERFATSCDVYVLTGDIPEDENDCDTADGRPRTKPRAAARVLRMVGADLDMLSMHDAIELAESFDLRLKGWIADTIRLQIYMNRFDVGRVILSGSGEFLARYAVERWNESRKTKTEIIRLSERIGPEASKAACAFALLQLANES